MFLHIYYNYLFNKVEVTYTKNIIGDREKTFELKDEFKGDIQPADEKSIKEEWGKDIEVDYKIYCDEDLKVGDYIKYNNNYYIINGKLDWINYKVYAIKGVDVK